MDGILLGIYRARSVSACFATEVITESGHGHQRPFISCPWRWRYPDLASEKESQTNQVSGVKDPFFFTQIFRECTSYCFTVIAVRQTNDTHKKRITSNKWNHQHCILSTGDIRVWQSVKHKLLLSKRHSLDNLFWCCIRLITSHVLSFHFLLRMISIAKSASKEKKSGGGTQFDADLSHICDPNSSTTCSKHQISQTLFQDVSSTAFDHFCSQCLQWLRASKDPACDQSPVSLHWSAPPTEKQEENIRNSLHSRKVQRCEHFQPPALTTGSDWLRLEISAPWPFCLQNSLIARCGYGTLPQCKAMEPLRSELLAQASRHSPLSKSSPVWSW